MSEVEFETINTKELKFGGSNFMEVAKKKALTEDGERPFISITRGYYKNDKKIFKKTVTIPSDKEIVRGLIHCLKSVAK